MTSTPPPAGPPDEPGTFLLVARLLAVQLLAVVAVAGVIAVVFTLAGRGTGPDTSAAGGAPTTTAATTAPSSVAATSAPATTPPPATAAPPAPSTTAPATPASSTPDRPKVDVLNQNAGSGAAATTAQDVRSAGWQVGRVADFSGNVATTTIYYPPGLRGQARALGRDLPGPQRLRSAFSTLSGSRLSIVLVG